MNQEQFNVLLTAALSDNQKAEDDAAAATKAQKVLDSATAQASRSLAQAVTSADAAKAALAELLIVVPTPDEEVIA